MKQKLYELLSDGDCVFIDVGANFGYWALRAAARGASVIAIEPDERNLKLLNANTEFNGFGRTIRVVAGCAGHKSGIREFAQERYGRKNTLVDYKGGQRGVYNSTIKVRCHTLDELVRGAHISDSSRLVLKIDVEGAETEVIQGAKHLISTFRPAIVFEALTPRAHMAVKNALQGIEPSYETVEIDRTNYYAYYANV
ncbi:FkbM family methyltransferase [Salinisphaera dokdonensis CL-ES53]|uniref:FkbM family methyltransferase n=1 Tax=Salinisphaera dokdonensis CL-ES53 TaxID=1304272 RepID=A0ABV2AX62_9GAMM